MTFDEESFPGVHKDNTSSSGGNISDEIDSSYWTNENEITFSESPNKSETESDSSDS